MPRDSKLWVRKFCKTASLRSVSRSDEVCGWAIVDFENPYGLPELFEIRLTDDFQVAFMPNRVYRMLQRPNDEIAQKAIDALNDLLKQERAVQAIERL